MNRRGRGSDSGKVKIKPVIITNPDESSTADSDVVSDTDSEDSALSHSEELCTADVEEKEDKELGIPVVCIFCDKEEKSVEDMFKHFEVVHDLNMHDWIFKFSMGQLQFIKMINYFRKIKGTYNVANKIVDLSFTYKRAPWLSDAYLIGSGEDDPMLCVDLETFSHITELDDEKYLKKVEPEETRPVTVEQLLSLTREVLNIVDDKDGQAGPSTSCKGSGSDLVKEDSSGYFESYADVDIHAAMLNDFARTDAYQKALNEGVCKGKTVLDVGCGTGILSLFAAKAGASRVCAIEQSDIIIETLDIIHENKMQGIIECVKTRVENFYSNEKFDVIVSEWMGYFLLFEGMLNSFIWARNNFLKDKGILIPSQASMYLAGVEDLAVRASNLDVWDDMYGFKMTAMKKKAAQQAHVIVVEPTSIVTDSFVLTEINLYTCTSQDAAVVKNFVLICERPCILTALVGYFDVILNDPASTSVIRLGTGPFDAPTHWKQCVFLLPQNIRMQKGQQLTGNFRCGPNWENKRWLDVKIQIDEPKMRFMYTLN